MWDPVPSCCCCSVAKLCLTLPDPMDCSTPGFPVSLTISQSKPKFMSIELVMQPPALGAQSVSTGPPGKSLGITSLHGALRMKEGWPVKPTIVHCKMAEWDSEAGPGSHCFHLALFGCLCSGKLAAML